MKIINLYSILLFLTISLNAQVVGPKISILEETFDFGNVPEGQIVTHNFVLTNTGGEVLEIQRVRASCGCTAAKPEKDKLNPGETTSIKVEFDSHNRSGEQKKYVYIFSNDKENPQTRLEFSVNVVDKYSQAAAEIKSPKLILSKTQHNFGKVKEGEVVTLNILVKNAGDNNLEISKVESTCNCITTVLSNKILKAGDSGSIKIDLNTSDRKGELTRVVNVFSNDPLNPNQSITLFVNIEDWKK